MKLSKKKKQGLSMERYKKVVRKAKPDTSTTCRNMKPAATNRYHHLDNETLWGD